MKRFVRIALDLVVLVLISAPSQVLACLLSGPVRGLYVRPEWWVAFFWAPVGTTVLWGTIYAAGRGRRVVSSAGILASIFGMLTVPIGLVMNIRTGIDLLLPILVFGSANAAAAIGLAKGRMHIAVRLLLVNGLFCALLFLQWILGHHLLREML